MEIITALALLSKSFKNSYQKGWFQQWPDRHIGKWSCWKFQKLTMRHWILCQSILDHFHWRLDTSRMDHPCWWSELTTILVMLMMMISLGRYSQRTDTCYKQPVIHRTQRSFTIRTSVNVFCSGRVICVGKIFLNHCINYNRKRCQNGCYKPN